MKNKAIVRNIGMLLSALILFGVSLAIVSPASGAEVKYEAENGTKAGGAKNYNDSAASGGKGVGYINKVGASLTLTNVAAGDQLQIQYATASYPAGQLSLYVNGVHNQDVVFAYTGGWTGSGKYALKTITIAIPANTTLKFQYDSGDAAVNLDYVKSVSSAPTSTPTQTLVPSPTATPPGPTPTSLPTPTVMPTIPVPNLLEMEEGVKLGNVQNYFDSEASLDTGVGYIDEVGDGVQFSNVSGGNQLEIRYATVYTGNLSLYINGAHTLDISFPKTHDTKWIEVYGLQVIPNLNIPAGATLKFQYDGGDVPVNLDYARITTINETTVTTVTGGRTTLKLNGFWDAEEQTSAQKDTIPSAWAHKVQVPGLVNMAYPELGSYDYVFYRRTFSLPGDLPEVALLKLNKAMYGKKVWINGISVGEHQPNFTPGYFNVQPYLLGNGQTNTLVVRVGNKETQPAGYIWGLDYEKHEYIPGIYDDVELILSGNHNVMRVQTAPDLANNRVRIVARFKNSSASSANIPVTLEVREKINGNLVGTANTSLSLNAGTEGEIDQNVVIANLHLWTPEDPFLYVLSVKSDNDQWDRIFGMRTFAFDPTTKKPTLNGNIYMLRGTNVTISRFFEDRESGSLPWNKEWVRQAIRAYKEMNINAARYCIGFPPELWYEVADEEGLLVQDEYPIWRMYDPWDNGATAASITPEVKDWIYERNNHPSVFMWDIVNETDSVESATIIGNVRSLDLQNRPWDNGWGTPQAPTDTKETHTYFNAIYPYSLAEWTTEWLMTPNYQLTDLYDYPANPVNLNEFGWLWLIRGGSSGTEMTKEVYNKNGAGYVPSGERSKIRDYYAKQEAQEAEWFRANRHAIVMHFAAFGYNEPGQGLTSDNWLPGIDRTALEPGFQKLMKDAMAPAGLMIEYWQKRELADSSKTITVHVMNDKSAPWSGTVTLKIMQGSTMLNSWTNQFSNVPTGYRSTQNYGVTFPTTPGDYQLIAEYTEDGKTVQSVRDVRVCATAYDLYGYGYQKMAVASSNFYGYYPATNVTDGLVETRWASDFSDPQWIYIDLGATQNIGVVELIWEASGGKDYQIQTSNNGLTWTTIYTKTGGVGGRELITGLSGSGRYVRMYGTARTTAYAYSLWEFRVWGPDGGGMLP